MCAEFFLRRKSCPATPRHAFGALSKTLSSRASRVVHEFSDMDEMPNLQVFLRFAAIGSHVRCEGASKVAVPPSRRRGGPCCDAPQAGGYTFP
jgi:hypothetical protein